MGWAACLGESMLQLPRVGVEAPRLLKRSLSRLCYCCCCQWLTRQVMFMPTQLYGQIVQEPSTTKNSSPLFGSPKTGAQLRENLEEREKCPPHHRPRTLAESPSSRLKTGRSTNSGDELNLWHLPRDPDDDLHNRDIVSLSERCNCGTSSVFCSVKPNTPVVVQQRACQRPCPRTARTVHCLYQPLTLAQ